MIETVDGPRVLELLAEVVRECGEDYIDPGAKVASGSCSYEFCIVGRVAACLGVVEEELLAWDEIGSVRVLRDSGRLPWLTPGGYRALRTAQDFQDQGFTWGRALEEARMAYGEDDGDV